MKNVVSLKLVVILVFILSSSCKKNETVFFEDDEAQNLSVFSDKGNNVMSCYINGQSFRTQDRIVPFGLFIGRIKPDINLGKISDGMGNDSLQISWYNDENPQGVSRISLILPVQNGFSYPDFNLLEGKRLQIDGVNSYFQINYGKAEKGTGNIYFQRAYIIPSDSTNISRFSGIFEATLPSYKITKGRFDHVLTSNVVFF